MEGLPCSPAVPGVPLLDAAPEEQQVRPGHSGEGGRCTEGRIPVLLEGRKAQPRTIRYTFTAPVRVSWRRRQQVLSHFMHVHTGMNSIHTCQFSLHTCRFYRRQECSTTTRAAPSRHSSARSWSRIYPHMALPLQQGGHGHMMHRRKWNSAHQRTVPAQTCRRIYCRL